MVSRASANGRWQNCTRLHRCMFYCAFQVFPASRVAKRCRSLDVIVAVFASTATMPIQSGNFPDESAPIAGGAIFSQWLPSVVRAMARFRPTIQQTVSETVAPASQSSCNGLACDVQVLPESEERWIFPPFPARQRIFADGVFNWR